MVAGQGSRNGRAGPASIESLRYRRGCIANVRSQASGVQASMDGKSTVRYASAAASRDAPVLGILLLAGRADILADVRSRCSKSPSAHLRAVFASNRIGRESNAGAVGNE